MIDALEKLDKQAAVGVLARAALALDGDGNPAAEARIEDEERIRTALWREARGELGLDQEDRKPEDIARVGDWLDELSERIIGSPDTQSALARLAERGDLPSDLYDIQIVQNVLDIYDADVSFQKKLIEETVRAPEIEQHYGPPEAEDAPAMISLFSRTFRTPWPFKDFSLLVAAQRGDGLILYVNQARRLYPSLVNIRETRNNLVKTLEQFANAYGEDINFGGRKGHFFIFADQPIPPNFSINLSGRRRGNINVSGFQQIDQKTQKERAALVVAIDVQRYQADLKRMVIREDQIIQSHLR